jgi:hypothetical protein
VEELFKRGGKLYIFGTDSKLVNSGVPIEMIIGEELSDTM